MEEIHKEAFVERKESDIYKEKGQKGKRNAIV